MGDEIPNHAWFAKFEVLFLFKVLFLSEEEENFNLII